MSNLYYIVNSGCDDSTCGLARISDEDFPKFKSFVENLNKNSTYQCMPRISVYQVEESNVRLCANRDPEWDRLYMDGDVYVLINRWNAGKCVIGEDVLA